MKTRQTKNKWRAAAAIMAALLIMTGCGSETYSADSAASINQAVSSVATEESKDAFYSESAEYETTEGQDGTATSMLSDTSRKLIKTVNMTVETEEYDQLLGVLNQKISALGGYTESFSTNGNRSYRYGNMTVRIPKNNLDAFLETIEGASNITYRQETVEDVTLDYVDVESRKKMLEKEQERLLELLEEAANLEDILTIEGRLTEVQYQLETRESQLRTYDNQIEYSTVYLDINEVARYTPQEEEGIWEQISRGFRENLEDVGEGILNFMITFITHIPNIIVFLILIGILALIVKAIIRIEKKHSDQKRAQQSARMQAAMQQQQQNQAPVQNAGQQTQDKDKK